MLPCASLQGGTIGTSQLSAEKEKLQTTWSGYPPRSDVVLAAIHAARNWDRDRSSRLSRRSPTKGTRVGEVQLLAPLVTDRPVKRVHGNHMSLYSAIADRLIHKRRPRTLLPKDCKHWPSANMLPSPSHDGLQPKTNDRYRSTAFSACPQVFHSPSKQPAFPCPRPASHLAQLGRHPRLEPESPPRDRHIEIRVQRWKWMPTPMD